MANEIPLNNNPNARQKRMSKEPKVVKQERNIPIHLLETEILPRLPIESLLRFKLVSKQWLAIISNPRFTKLHLNQSISTQHSNLLVDTGINSLYLLNHADHRMLKPNQELINRGGLGSGIELIDSSNGLICLITGRNTLCFFNPATRVSRQVICPKAIYGDSLLRAFGYSITNDEYKFIYVNTICPVNVPITAHVYSLRSNDDLHNWKELNVDKALIRHNGGFRDKGSIINEKAHWTMQERYGCDFSILAFDLANETFNEVSRPQLCGGQDNGSHAGIFISGIKQNLSVCYKVRKSNGFYVEVWMMMRYGVSESWSRIYNFELGRNTVTQIITPCKSFAITREEGELFFIVSGCKLLLVKDLNVRQPSYVEVFDYYYNVRSIKKHVNSLVSPFIC